MIKLVKLYGLKGVEFQVGFNHCYVCNIVAGLHGVSVQYWTEESFPCSRCGVR